MATTAIDEAKLHAFLGKAAGDFAAAASSALVALGDTLGLYRAMAGAGPLTSAELAGRTGTQERRVREWLVNQAAGGYIEYDPPTGRYTLPWEHALALVDATSPFYVAGGYQAIASITAAQPRIAETFRAAVELPLGDQVSGSFKEAERFFSPGYAANVVSSWIPALDGVEAKLRAGAVVVVVGCGNGVCTVAMARAYPRSRFFGYDDHAPSIARARQDAVDAGVANRVIFEVASATGYPGGDYDLIAYFDCLHDMGDPVGAIRHARETLATDGTVLIVEPMAGERVEDNFNPVGVVYSAASVLCRTTNALPSGQGRALSSIVPEAQLRQVVTSGGLSRIRRVAQTPFNRIFEARP